MKDTRLQIFAVYVLGLAACLVAITTLRMSDKIYPDTSTSMMAAILKIYSAPLGIILAGFFTVNRKRLQSKQPPFIIALSVSIVWNILFSARLISSCFLSEDDPKLIYDYFDKISLYATFLNTACISFYFLDAKKKESINVD